LVNQLIRARNFLGRNRHQSQPILDFRFYRT
jgi:hypothetical protein